MKSVYVESTIISYLAARRSRDSIKEARQRLTWEWWRNRRRLYKLFIFGLVMDETLDGDDDAIRRRAELVQT